MNKAPSPSRLRLDTSPPEGVEEGRKAETQNSLPRPLQGERWPAKRGGEGEAGKKPARRKEGATARARRLRQAGNQAEALLWLELKAERLAGHHFTRQQPIGPYFADFCCRKQKLVVELDGSQHADSPYDCKRDEFMRAQGFSVLRFWSHDARKHRSPVCETILAALDGRLAEDMIAPDLRFVFARGRTK